ncbi:MAG: S8 family serine peptidase [Prevotella sp.]|nr:S8 family serine peptidase [Prevotella sp.]
MKRLLHVILFLAVLAAPACGQQSQLGKLSPMLRRLVRTTDSQNAPAAQRSPLSSKRCVCAFIRLSDNGEEALAEHGCRSLAHFGPLHIAEIPVSSLAPLTLDRRVERIEAEAINRLHTDSMAIHLHATEAYAGQGLPQAYTGRGVVMGIMDVGFDLTHPNFYSRDTTDYRIRRFWDQISQDTVGSPLPVGRDYTTREELLALGHSRDGLDITHGTHTLGIAAGSGYNSSYRGMAPEADICLVANAVSDDLPYIDSADVEKYTYATDALGFKYIFDYAESVGRPCVISFSEGSPQDFYGYDLLYYAFLDSLVGPGRIIVASAGNEGANRNWIHKPRGQEGAGTFVYYGGQAMYVMAKSADDFLFRLVAYTAPNDTLLIDTRQVLSQPDSVLALTAAGFSVEVAAYPSCYDERDICYDLAISGERMVGVAPHLSLEILGADADIELWRLSGKFRTFDENLLLADGDNTHHVHSPSSAPCVISVGNNSYREYIVNVQGDTLSYWPGAGGIICEPSSRGPTLDGRIKPDCVAPGNNIISSYSSYYLETHPDAGDIRWDVDHFPFAGRTYAWNSNSGTSMSSPAVGGAVALWLQACPTLTPEDVMGVLSRTCRHTDPSLPYPNNTYGHGEIDVYAGLLDILGLAGIDDIPKTHTQASLSLMGRQLHIILPEAPTKSLPLRIYDLNGRPVLSVLLPEGHADHYITLPQLTAGVYAVCVGQSSTLIRINP